MNNRYGCSFDDACNSSLIHQQLHREKTKLGNLWWFSNHITKYFFNQMCMKNYNVTFRTGYMSIYWLSINRHKLQGCSGLRWRYMKYGQQRTNRRSYFFHDECMSLLNNVDNCDLINTLRPRQNGRHLADDTFKRIFLNENVRISIKISLKFVPKGQINNIPALVQIMAWRRPGDKPLSEPMMVRLLTHIGVTRPQWVKSVHIITRNCDMGCDTLAHDDWYNYSDLKVQLAVIGLVCRSTRRELGVSVGQIEVNDMVACKDTCKGMAMFTSGVQIFSVGPEICRVYLVIVMFPDVLESCITRWPVSTTMSIIT